MEYRYETDNFPVIRAKWFTDVTAKRTVRVIVIHTMVSLIKTREHKVLIKLREHKVKEEATVNQKNSA